MWSVLRLAARNAVVGLLGVVVAMISMGLAIVALDEEHELTLLAWIPFGIATGFGVLFIGAWLYLSYEAAVVGRKIQSLREYIRGGLKLRTDILDKVIDGDAERKQALVGWHDSVVNWIEANEPDYITDFETAAPGILRGFTSSSVGRQASFYVYIIDLKLGALKELISDLRVRR